VGVIWEDGVVNPVPPIRKALKKVVEGLAAEGVELVDFRLLDSEQETGWGIISKSYYIDGGKRLRAKMDGEPLLPLGEWITSHCPEEYTGTQVHELMGAREDFQLQFLTRFRSMNLDVILCPASPTPATLHGTAKYWSYTALWNLLDWPAAIFPTGTHVGPGDDETDYEPRNAKEKAIYDLWSAEKYDHAPIGLQMVAPMFEDERLMAALGWVEAALGHMTSHLDK